MKRKIIALVLGMGFALGTAGNALASPIDDAIRLMLLVQQQQAQQQAAQQQAAHQQVLKAIAGL
jgi:hypothetical protein